jgi:gag-polypeptide of LTR copia-type
MKILARKIKNLGQEVSEDDLIIMVLHNLPREYKSIVEILENKLGNGDLNILKVKERLINKYSKLKNGKKTSEMMWVSWLMKKDWKIISTDSKNP